MRLGAVGRVGDAWQTWHGQLILMLPSRLCQQILLPAKCPHSSQVLDLDVTPHEHLPVSACEQGGAVCEALAAGIMGQDKVRSLWSHEYFLRGMIFLRKQVHSHWVIVFPCKPVCSVVKLVSAVRWMEL